MSFKAHHLPYRHTKSFSNIVYDYLDARESLKPFYAFSADKKGIAAAIENRKQFPVNRKMLTEELRRRYASLPVTEAIEKNLQLLEFDSCFTICTAHQPNIFTGHLYFVYKILHAIKLSEELKNEFPDNHFVPVYYMGSEDADLDELGEVAIGGKKRQWQTNQSGAVGRMKVDKALISLIDEIEGQLGVMPHGKETIELLRVHYTYGKSIEEATFGLVNDMFGSFGLIVLLPDSPAFKNLFVPVMQKELEAQFSAKAVEETVNQFPEQYKIQAAGRDLNLFYLDEEGRNRIEKIGDEYQVVNTKKQFSKSAIIKELNDHPEKFSPNVILRPALQETILPNVAFIGGGGELAYWLELKSVFQKAGVAYPVLFLRNSFLMINCKHKSLYEKLGLQINDLFDDEVELAATWVSRHSDVQVSLQYELEELRNYYHKLQAITAKVDITLSRHAEALMVKAEDKIKALEKKLLRAEKRKHDASIKQIEKLKSGLFPGKNLQERVENIMPWLSVFGMGLLEKIYNSSPALSPSFTILEEC